jgi:tagatose 6-phosphate kinase
MQKLSFRSSMILCIGTTPAAQRVMIFPRLSIDRVNRAARTVDGVAGKSINVAKVLHALGARPLATGFLGGPRGEEIQILFKQRGIPSDFVSVDAPTRQCITVIDKAAGTITELVEESRPVDGVYFDQLWTIVCNHAPRCHAIVMSGTIATGGPRDFYRRCTELATQVGALSVVDASGPPLLEALEARPGLIKPNLAELEATVGRTLGTDESAIHQAMRDLHAKGRCKVIVTAGSAPVRAFDGQQFWTIQVPVVSTVNPIGSGDAFTAALVWQLLAGNDLGEACRWAVAAGAANALTEMAGEVVMKDVERLAQCVTEEAAERP